MGLQTARAAGIAVLLAAGGACAPAEQRPAQDAAAPASEAVPPGTLETAVFAGGCFWCMEPPFEKLPGVVSVVSGYTGGDVKDPTYKQVSSGRTGHAEAVEVSYDPSRIGYDELLEVFWVNVDPTQDDRQFCDRGRQYRPAIFYRGQEQKSLAEASRKDAAKKLRVDAPIKVEIVPASRFFPAEDYHQDYYKKNSIRYKYYRRGCGRDRRLRELWGEGP